MKKIIDFIKKLFGLSVSEPEVKFTETVLKPISQVKQIKNHFLEFGSISKKDSRLFYGINSLSKIVYKLRKRGMKIVYNENTKIYTYEPKA
jgi:hypothetical protein